MLYARRALALSSFAFFISHCAAPPDAIDSSEARAVSAVSAALPAPPAQPASGPGGADYSYGVKVTAYGFGALRYWLYEPIDGPARSAAPTYIFVHGATMSPSPTATNFDTMLRHFARKGFNVVYPEYCDPWALCLDYQPSFTSAGQQANLEESIRRALAELSSTAHGHTPPLRDAAGRTAYALAAHSLGAILSLNLASRAAQPGLAGIPAPRALILNEPAGSRPDLVNFHKLQVTAPEQIDADTLLVIALGDLSAAVARDPNENNFGVIDPAWRHTPQIPASRRNGLVIPSDDHGAPPLTSNHDGIGYSSTDSKLPLDAIDWAYWRINEAAASFALEGANGDYVLGDGPLVKSMGLWSDGQPVNDVVTSSPIFQ
jgi:pimeloyl-ACP methyl ester carboxylesterase